MFTQIFKNFSPIVKLMLFVVFAIACFLVTLFVGVVIGYMSLGGSDFMVNIQQLDFEIPGVLTAQKYMQGVYTIGLFILPALLYPLLLGDKTGTYLQLRKAPIPRSAVYAILLIPAILPLVNYTNALNQLVPFPDNLEHIFKELEASAERVTTAFLSNMTFPGYLTNLVLIAVLPALGEELFFRGIVQRLFGESVKNHHLAILFTAITFSAFHLQFYGFFPRLILGLVLGYLFLWSKSLWLPMLAHFINNGLAVTVMYYSEHASSEKLQKLELLEKGELQYALLSIMLTAVLLYGIYQTEETK